jgi:predicted nucleic acid-binding protein
LSSEVRSIIARHDPARWAKTLAYRKKDLLPYDPTRLPAGAPLSLDTTTYIDQLKGQLPRAIVGLIASRIILHAAPAMAELAITLGVLDPTDNRTSANLQPIRDTLERVDPRRIIVPSHDAWLEAPVIAGILARTQHIPKEQRRKFLNDTLLFLMAAEAGSILVTRNSRDFDLLLQIKPRNTILLYDRA